MLHMYTILCVKRNITRNAACAVRCRYLLSTNFSSSILLPDTCTASRPGFVFGHLLDERTTTPHLASRSTLTDLCFVSHNKEFA